MVVPFEKTVCSQLGSSAFISPPDWALNPMLGLATLLPSHLAQRDYPAATFLTARVVRPALPQHTWMAFTTQRAASLAVRTVGRLLHALSPALARQVGR